MFKPRFHYTQLITLHSSQLKIAVFVLFLIGTSTTNAQSIDSLEAVADRAFSWVNPDSPGCTVGVSQNGQTVLLKSYGNANLEFNIPLTPESVIDAGSIAKQFTAAAVLLLVQEGKLSLDDQVSKYLSEFPNYETPVTIRHLLSHTSGVREWSSIALLSGWSPVVSRYFPSEILDILSRQQALNFEPGSAYAYSNSNYFLAALIVERVSGMTFVEFTNRYIFVPADMTCTLWRDDINRVIPDKVTAYAPAGEGSYRIAMPLWNLYGYGGLLTTVGDLLAWNNALVNGRILDTDYVKSMETPFTLLNGSTAPAGLGLDSRLYRGIQEVSHGGADIGFRAHAVRYPEHNVTVVVLCNNSSAFPRGDAQTIAEALIPFQSAPSSSSPVVSTVLSEKELDRMAGLYRDLQTGSVLRINVNEGAWTYPGSTYFGPATFIPITNNTFVAGRGDLEGEFIINNDSPNRLIVRSPSVPMTIDYERVEEWIPSVRELTGYSGRFTSEEAQTTFTIVYNDDDLRLNMGLRRGVPLVPIYHDAFTAGPLGTVKFIRDKYKNIVGLTVSDNRSFGVFFEREKSI